MKSRLSLLALTLVVSTTAWAQTGPAPVPAPAPDAATPPPAADGGSDVGANPRGNRRDRANFNPDEIRNRIMNNLREQMGVTKDDEWAIITERVTALYESRRASSGFSAGPGGLMAMRPVGGPPGGGAGGAPGGGAGGGQGGGRDRRGGPPEVQALQAALKDNAPDAEIQSRLAKLREVRKENDAKITKAQDDLRAVLSVRQEAVAVMNGLLP